jgi:predicted ArsR family transcriptional regulator
MDILAHKLGELRYAERLRILRHLAEVQSCTLQSIVEALGHQWDPSSAIAQAIRRHLRVLEEVGFVSHEREHDGKIPMDIYFFEKDMWRSFAGSLALTMGAGSL